LSEASQYIEKYLLSSLHEVLLSHLSKKYDDLQKGMDVNGIDHMASLLK
jgi:hypothetical protein